MAISMSTVVIGHWPRQAWGTQAVDAPSVGQVPSQPPSAPPPDDDRLYRVTVLWPYVYEVWARDAAQAKRKVMQTQPIELTPRAVLFPTEVKVEVVE